MAWPRIRMSLCVVFTLTGLCLPGSTCPAVAQPPNRGFAGLPPRGLAMPQEQAEQIAAQLTQLESQLEQLNGPSASRSADQYVDRTPDVECLLKAVRLSLEFNEFYQEADFTLPLLCLDLAAARLTELAGNSAPSWTQAKGLVVRGFRSAIDGSTQPYGLEIPNSLSLDRPVPLYVWLHGRGDKTTDLHFICERLEKAGQIQPDNAIVLHPFGRQCLGYKSAGETDVLEAIAHVQANYSIDPHRIVLMGFSMGGAGAWHLGAHFAERFVAVSPGAGFAETARYNRLSPEQYPVDYEQTLWSQYDVPNYVRNLFNLPVIAYSGENDPQMQAARVMSEAFEQNGRTLVHHIGPGMGHRYHPDTLKQILTELDAAVQQGQSDPAKQVFLQTRTLKYPSMHWVRAERLTQHWQDARIDGQLDEDNNVSLVTQGVTALSLTLPTPPRRIQIDGQSIDVPSVNAENPIYLQQSQSQWQLTATLASTHRAKRPTLQGPIDDCFTGPFLVVAPSRPAAHPEIDAWLQKEMAYLERRWRAVFRGELRVRRDIDVSPEDLQQYHLLVWGDPAGNSILAKILGELPIRWHDEQLVVGGQQYAATDHIPVLIYPNPLNPDRYVVLNSGPTFRDAHDRTNSLQNPQLPDWAVLKVSPDSSGPQQAGEVKAAGFFDESWQP